MLLAPPELARRALEAAPDAMLIIDASGIIWFTNRQVLALFGHPQDEIIGLSIEHLMPERFRTRHLRHSDHYTNDVRPMGVGLELYGRRKDGREFPTQQGERAQTGLDAPAGARPGPLSRHVLAALDLR